MNYHDNQLRGEVPQTSPSYQQSETKFCIIVDAKTPIIMKVPIEPSNITLGQFKRLASLQGPNYKFYFRSRDNEFGIVKEELTDDDAIVPVEGDRIVAWVLSNTINQAALFSLEDHSPLRDSLKSSRQNPTLQESHYSASSNAKPTTLAQIHVHLVLDNTNFLGLTLVGRIDELDSRDKGIYVGKIAENSIIDRDGRVEVGDRIIGVNGFNLLSVANDEAVTTFKRCVEQRGAISLLLERRSSLVSPSLIWNNSKNSSFYQTPPRLLTKPIESINDISVPDGHMDSLTSRQSLNIQHRSARSLPRSITPKSIYQTTGSDNMTYNDSPLSLNSRSLYETATTPPSIRRTDVTLHCRRHDIHTVFSALRDNPTGLDLRDREWLRVVIKDAFLGSDLIRWLSRNVYGFNGRRELKSYANQMLSLGLIKNPMTSGSFSERCFYTFC